ncbi:NaeI family type II restriction endonuclease [Corynebacterium ulceribovis]|uniref:NaeI family type II restriction endonuclease n=1 Tax=Corynebacterium ulceribovis TaxID=487732 RepID=UPI00036ADDC1|nr:NaeI family type II restriction endonuclease [Corynebacterium ulceribovis]
MFDSPLEVQLADAVYRPDATSLRLAEALRSWDVGGTTIARTFRETYDQLYDGMHTGRYRWDQLHKTEKTHFGTLIEINLRRALDGFLADGLVMDFKVHLPAVLRQGLPEVNAEVDCKFSQTLYAWMIPNEALGHWAMVCHASDTDSTWSVGFVHITPKILTKGGNRDQKRTIKKDGRTAVAWAWQDEPLPPNVLLQLPSEAAEYILEPSSGQQRVNRLFEEAVGSIVPRGTVETVAQQKDSMKRVRSSGGARTALQPSGIIILGDYVFHRDVATKLGLPVPGAGDFISAYVARAKDFPTNPNRVFLEDDWWVVVSKDDVTGPAPTFGHKPTKQEASAF